MSDFENEVAKTVIETGSYGPPFYEKATLIERLHAIARCCVTSAAMLELAEDKSSVFRAALNRGQADLLRRAAAMVDEIRAELLAEGKEP